MSRFGSRSGDTGVDDGDDSGGNGLLLVLVVAVRGWRLGRTGHLVT